MLSEGRITLPDGTARLVEGARIFALFGLVVLLAIFVARAAWLIIAPADAVSTLTPRSLPTPLQQVTRTDVRSDLSLLMTRNPFQGGATTTEVVTSAPETSLNLKLVALFMSTDADADSATIVTPDNRSQRFQPGEEIIPGVVLERVMADRVIISRDGSEESLIRGGRQAGLSVLGSPSDEPAVTTAVSTQAPAQFAPGVSARTLLASVEPFAEVEGNVVTAYTLRPRGNPQLMQDAGLEPGDKLIAVNGRQVSALDTAGLAAEFGSARTVSVTVLRGGETQSLDISFEEG